MIAPSEPALPSPQAAFPGTGPGPGRAGLTDQMVHLRREVEQLQLEYRSGLDEIETKLRILQREFAQTHDYNPIESISTRVKSLPSLFQKARARGCTTLDEVREFITDIAGIRVVCSFRQDVFRIRDMLAQQGDVTLVTEKDYVSSPKANGYRSLHLIVTVPVYLSDRAVSVPVEVQLRTIAMDFWASLEHKTKYKFDGAIPAELLAGLAKAAETAATLDTDMEGLHLEVSKLRSPESEDSMAELVADAMSFLANPDIEAP